MTVKGELPGEFAGSAVHMPVIPDGAAACFDGQRQNPFHLAAEGSLTVAERTYTFGPEAEATVIMSLDKTVRCTESFLGSTADGGIYSYRTKNGGEMLTTDGIKGEPLSVSNGEVLQPRTLSSTVNGTFTPFFNERMDYTRPFLHSHADRLHGRFESDGQSGFAVLTLSRKA